MNKYDEIVARLAGEFGGVSFGGMPITLTEKELKDVELEIGFVLPKDYREFLLAFGGFYFGGATFLLKENSDGVDEGSIEVFYGVNPADGTSVLIDNYRQCCDSFVRWPVGLILGIRLVRPRHDDVEIGWPIELLPIAMDAGNNQICLCLAGPRLGAVFLWINAPGEGFQNVYLIADSFDEFIRSIYLRN